VRARKAARPTTARTVNGPHASSNLPGGSGRSYSNSKLSVYSGRCLLGFVTRHRDGLEASDADGHTIGMFATERAALDAISTRAAS
jgi:hypothetical protein